MSPSISISPYDDGEHREAVIELWRSVFSYDAPHNEPRLIIDKKEAADDGLFFVALDQGEKVVGTVMCGYDGHRGWIYSLAVSPKIRRTGLGTILMSHAMDSLHTLGCLKVNLQIVEGNEEVENFYKTLGFNKEKRISMGRCLDANETITEALDCGGESPCSKTSGKK